MKNLKKILGISFLAQSVSFGILFFILARKKKSSSKAFAAMSILGGLAGCVLFYLGMTETKKKKRLLALEDCCDCDDDFEDDFDDDLSCAFEDEDLWDDLEDEEEAEEAKDEKDEEAKD